MRLADSTLARVPATIQRPRYDRRAQQPGIVHFGIGGFHRAHQAVYTEDAMDAGARDWGIVGVSLRSPDVAERMNPQDGLYSLVSRDGESVHYRVIGAVQKVLVATQAGEAVLAALASPRTHIASFTITEKGYCRAPDGTLDPTLAHEGSVYRFLAAGLGRRREQGLPGLTLLSCDNLADNGAQLRRLLGEYLAERQPAVADWVDANCAFPATMVDRIVPATTGPDHAAAQLALGLRDEAHVTAERFSQWVIEDSFAGPRPPWEEHGAEFVADVRPYETAKLRMLNGAHSALAYLGMLRGHRFVHEAIADTSIRPLIERLVRAEAANSVGAAPGQDLAAYADALLARFANSSLQHRLTQIAMDGSQKIPQRWLATLDYHQRAGRRCDAILTALAAWLLHVRGDSGHAVDDPMADRLAALWTNQGTHRIVPACFGEGGLLAAGWRPTTDDVAFVVQAFDAIRQP